MQTTDSQDEIFPVVDEYDNLIGQTTRKIANSSPNLIHRGVGIFIYNSADKLLIHKRSQTKDTSPGCWDSDIGGHVIFGDDYLNTAIREIQEEIGVDARAGDLTPLKKILVKMPWETEFQQIYEYRLPKNANISFNRQEISEIKFVSMPELKRLLANSKIEWSLSARQRIKECLSL